MSVLEYNAFKRKNESDPDKLDRKLFCILERCAMCKHYVNFKNIKELSKNSWSQPKTSNESYSKQHNSYDHLSTQNLLQLSKPSAISSVFKWITANLKSYFSFSNAGCHNKVKQPSLSNH